MKKSFRHCKMAAAHRCFSKWVFLKVSQHWSLFSIKLQAFFYRTPAVAASGFSRQQIRFSAKSGMCWRQSHRFLSLTSLKTQVKRQKQPLKLFYEKGVLRNVVNFTGKHLYRSLALIELQAKRFKYRCFPVEFTKYLKTEVYQRLLLKPVVSPGVSFRISYTCGSNWFMVFRS